MSELEKIDNVEDLKTIPTDNTTGEVSGEEIYARYWYARDVLLKNAQTKEEIQSITILSN